MLYTTPYITCYFVFLALLLGACMGSFLNCMAWRIVHNEPISKGRSHCDVCGHTLGIGDLIPVISYITHRGRCRYCGVRLSAVHVIAEAVSAVLFAAVLLKFDISLQALEYLIFVCLLLVCSFADLEGRIIPDRFIITGLLVRTGFFVILNDSVRVALDDLIGGIGIAGLLLAVVLVFEKIKGIEAMGGGDIKLIFMTGIFLGWRANLLCLFTGLYHRDCIWSCFQIGGRGQDISMGSFNSTGSGNMHAVWQRGHRALSGTVLD